MGTAESTIILAVEARLDDECMPALEELKASKESRIEAREQAAGSIFDLNNPKPKLAAAPVVPSVPVYSSSGSSSGPSGVSTGESDSSDG